MLSQSERERLTKKAEAWQWVASEFRRIRDIMRAEADRLYGPNRGE